MPKAQLQLQYLAPNIDSLEDLQSLFNLTNATDTPFV